MAGELACRTAGVSEAARAKIMAAQFAVCGARRHRAPCDWLSRVPNLASANRACRRCVNSLLAGRWHTGRRSRLPASSASACTGRLWSFGHR